ncbi:ribbon-helix-helix domain-containing protein [Myxococcota bacterium]|nr:ribbon-helix-helix domain-containing protein [Myxococcota bacterium]
MARRKVLTTVYLEPEQDALLKALSERTGVPVAAYIRQGIDLVLEAHEQVLPGQLSLFGDGPRPARPTRARGRRR